MTASPNGARVTFLRNLANINMDVGTTETLSSSRSAATTDHGRGPSRADHDRRRRRRRRGHHQHDGLDGPHGQRRHRGRHAELRRRGPGRSQTTSTISVAGQTRVTHTLIENINVPNTPSGALPTITITSPTADPTTTSTAPFITLAGHGVRRCRHGLGHVGQRPRRQRARDGHDELDGREHPARRRAPT